MIQIRRTRAVVWALSIICTAAFIGTAYADSETTGATVEPTRVSAELSASAQAIIDEDNARVTGIFKDIHQNPELGFMEKRTAGIVARELESLGFEVKTGIGKTGVVGVLRNGEGSTVLYRADMDANAVEEMTGLPYASEVRVKREDGGEVPVAHMCGHDAHVAWMLGVAKALVDVKAEWSGTLVMVGQPAEEQLEGAQAMIDDGLYVEHGMPTPDFMLALHTVPLPVGKVANVAGVRMAGTDQIDVTFHGVGGHGSSPQFAKDPVLMAAMAVVQYQAIISRIIDPQKAAVLTVGSIQAGTDNNVIPSTALVKINLRWFSETVREQMINGIRAISESIARAYGLPDDMMPTMVMKGTSTPLVNDATLVKRLQHPLEQLVGEEQVVTDFPTTTGSEDAHLLLGAQQDVPLAYLVVGVAAPEAFAKAGNKPPYYNHSSDYKVELDAIPFGTKVGTIAALELLAK
jgi:hippurate hydrolase